MKIKVIIIFVGLNLFLFTKTNAQAQDLKNVEYTVIAEGIDSPLPELQIVCYNKYFNQDYLPADFRKKYNLDEKGLYKKKMLVELFHPDAGLKGLDKIEFLGIQENDETLIVNYKLVNSNPENDKEKISPFLIVQVPKTKKEIKFIANGMELGKGTELYAD